MPKSIALLIADAPLKAVLLNSVALEVLSSDRSETSVTITTGYEAAVKSPVADVFLASVLVEILGVEPKSARTQFTAKAKMTGFYEIGREIDLSKIDEVSGPAIERARAQVYPQVRGVLSDLLGKAGIVIKNFALEAPKPPLAEGDTAASPPVRAKKARKRTTVSKT